MRRGTIRVGIGGWTYEPWRGLFYPPGLPHARELEFAASRVTAIEINATYYRLQSPASFARWRDATPPGFVFTLKGSRFCTNRKVLAEAGDGIAKFLAQGLTELGDKLGPILWQLMATKRFEPDDMAAFLALLPAAYNGLPLRHAIEPRHESFRAPAFFAMARKAGVAVVLADSEEYPRFEEQTASFSYVRLQRARESVRTGYTKSELADWTNKLEDLSARGDVFAYFIDGAKRRAPAAAEALIAQLVSARG